MRTKRTPKFKIFKGMKNPKILKIEDGVLFFTYLWQNALSVPAEAGMEEPLTGAWYFGKATVALPTISDLNGSEIPRGGSPDTNGVYQYMPSCPWRFVSAHYDGQFNAPLFTELQDKHGHDFAGKSRLHSHFDIPFRGRSYGVTGTRTQTISTKENSLY